ncbi:homoserine lactone transporter [Hahella sp. CCB-MM4]|uniref:LysE family translocator n=1 Tax=Hahella sp. (strain CCB-MM4) TaxID=1926491 RepID=UPI000B9A35B3|nr:LysE family translocator [Hahella sp. CCB-MM4]OZG72817.1 homoserine lactone transporter [Hahella sp. CCB-MM4]
MLGIEDLWFFLTASIILWITPGPDTMYILGRTISQGRTAGVVSVLGIGAGILAHTFFAAVGLSAILMASATAFTLIKVAGAAYLIYLGIQTYRSGKELKAAHPLPHQKHWKVFRQGFLTNLLNPKIAIFFLAFLPQFVSPAEQHPAAAFTLLGGIFVVGGTLWCLSLVLFAARFTRMVRSNESLSARINRIVGVVYVGLGLNLLSSKLQS